MISPADLSGQFALDVQGMNQLKLDAKQPSREALQKAAQQFEALFMNMMLKSMRDATPQDGMFDSEQTRTFTAMLDQQLSQSLASRGVGLAEMMVRQLSSTMPPEEGAAVMLSVDGAAGMPLAAPELAPVAVPQTGNAGSGDSRVQNFTQRLMPHAMEASAATGIPAQFMLGQAALESGWGRGEIRDADGQQSYNLFNIKATGGWKGRSMEVLTTEYVNGVPEKRVEAFRAYDSYADAFRDYANLLRSNPRYQNVIAQGQDAAGFALGLQRAGYATDPNYAQKLMGVIRRVASA